MSDATTATQPWRSEIAVLVRHTSQARVLLIGGRVPLLRFEPLVESSNAEHIAARLRVELGCDTLLLGSLWGEYDEAARMHRAVVVCIARDAASEPPAGGRWVDAAAAEAFPWPDEPARAAVSGLQRLLGGAPDPRRAPWAEPGWYQAAAAWAEGALDGTPSRAAGPFVQVRVWCISCVLCAPTVQGDVYFKAGGGSALFADEPAVMQALARQFPELVPAPLAREPERGWMLLPDLGATLRKSNDHELRVETMTAYGRMQRALAGQVGPLLDAGLHDRRLSSLAAQIELLLADDMTREVLGGELHARLAAAVPRLSALLDDLAGFAIPPSVVHGDLHAGNVAVCDGRIAIFDWTDASVAHPFFDLVTFALSARGLPDGAALSERIISAYLALWEDYESPRRLREAWHLAAIAGSLHQVVSYRYILAGAATAARWECSDGLVEYTMELLQRLDGSAS